MKKQPLPGYLKLGGVTHYVLLTAGEGGALNPDWILAFAKKNNCAYKPVGGQWRVYAAFPGEVIECYDERRLNKKIEECRRRYRRWIL